MQTFPLIHLPTSPYMPLASIHCFRFYFVLFRIIFLWLCCPLHKLYVRIRYFCNIFDLIYLTMVELSAPRVVQVLYSPCPLIARYHQKAIKWTAFQSMNRIKSHWITPTQQKNIILQFFYESKRFSLVRTQLRSIRMELILGQVLNLKIVEYRSRLAWE